MKSNTKIIAVAVFATVFLLGALIVEATAQEAKPPTDNGPQTLDTRIGKLTFTHDFINGRGLPSSGSMGLPKPTSTRSGHCLILRGRSETSAKKNAPSDLESN
jgi:hypothetical protein